MMTSFMERSYFFHTLQFFLPPLFVFFRIEIHICLPWKTWDWFLASQYCSCLRLFDLFLLFVLAGRRCYYGPELQWHASWHAPCQVKTCFPCMFWTIVTCEADLSQFPQRFPALLWVAQGESIKDSSPPPFTSCDVALSLALVWSQRPGQQFWATNP